MRHGLPRRRLNSQILDDRDRSILPPRGASQPRTLRRNADHYFIASLRTNIAHLHLPRGARLRPPSPPPVWVGQDLFGGTELVKAPSPFPPCGERCGERGRE